jgi:hypothetical protein
MKILLSFVAVLAIALPCQAQAITISSPTHRATVEVNSFVGMTGAASGTWPPAPSIVVQIFRDNGMAFENYGYCTAQLDLETGDWLTGFTPGLTGQYFLTACLYQGTDIVATDSILINVVDSSPVKK